jgi:hypothetical protein
MGERKGFLKKNAVTVSGGGGGRGGEVMRASCGPRVTPSIGNVCHYATLPFLTWHSDTRHYMVICHVTKFKFSKNKKEEERRSYVT